MRLLNYLFLILLYVIFFKSPGHGTPQPTTPLVLQGLWGVIYSTGHETALAEWKPNANKGIVSFL